jgi:hypothetical protein
VSGYYENIFICIFYFKIVLNNLSLGNAGCRSFGMIQNLVEKKKKKYRLRSNLMFLIGSDMNVVLPANKDQENRHDGETKQLHRRIEWLSLIRVVIDSSIHYPIPGPSY